MAPDTRQTPTPGVFRRLAALGYDLMLLFGVLMIAVTLLIIPYQLILGVPFPHGEPFHRLGLRLYLIAIIGLFFTFFWVRGGQTLGMRTWRLRLVREDGRPLRPRDALRRLVWATLCLAPAGAGLWWMLFDRERLAGHDRLSHTRPIRVRD
ncbi:MAG: RDD family protein [Candidatus Thiosymbion ectosymbiont of Robbea hypermnestra]|nr:RDD family protein [Candidatus Thiosymbion ectosymbiont of Robbea hypermnestra]